MLTLDGVCGGGAGVLTHGLDISQGPENTTVFHNETFLKMHVGLRVEGAESIGFVLQPGENRVIENLEGEYDLSITHILEFIDLIAATDGRVFSFTLVETEATCNGHGAKLEITAVEETAEAH